MGNSPHFWMAADSPGGSVFLVYLSTDQKYPRCTLDDPYWAILADQKPGGTWGGLERGMFFEGTQPPDNSNLVLQKPVILKNPMHRSGLTLARVQVTLAAWNKGEIPSPDNDDMVTTEEVVDLRLKGSRLAPGLLWFSLLHFIFLALAEVQRNWLVKLREEQGLAEAVRIAGPFIMSSQGRP